MSSCNNKVLAIRDAFKKAVRSAGKAFMLDADDVVMTRLYRLIPSVCYSRNVDYDDNNNDVDVKVNAVLSMELSNDRDSFCLTFNGARELVKQLIEMLDKLDKMEDKYLAALEKVSKDKVEASKEATETFKF